MRYTGWWFGTWILFSISYMGCHPSHWHSYFSRLLKPPTRHTGWWFRTWILFSIIYGMSSFPLTFIFFKIVKTTNQIYWLVVWNMHFIFPIILGISSSQLTNSYFSEGLKPPTSIADQYRMGPHSWLSWFITIITIVYDTQITIFGRGYKPTYNWRAPSCT